MPERVKLTVRMTPEQYEVLRDYSRMAGRSVSDATRTLVSDGIARDMATRQAEAAALAARATAPIVGRRWAPRPKI